MRYELRIQDPTEPPQSALLDVVEQLVGEGKVVAGRLFFGFLTGSGVHALLAIPEVANVLRSAELEVVVGLDSVTNRAGLKALQALSETNPGFDVKVIKNTTGVLVHSKLFLFEYEDGSGVVVVGSNNLSHSGLSGNVEAYSVYRYESDAKPDLSDWDAFVERWDALLSSIDDEAFDRAKRNERRMERIRRAARRQPAGEPPVTVVVTDGEAHETIAEAAEPVLEPMVISFVPKGGDRWSQVHLSAEILRDFFGLEPDEHGVVHIREHGSTRVEDRPVVYSAGSNKNVKIQVGAAQAASRTIGYPPDHEGRPIVVFRREGGADRYVYVLLMPGDPGHKEMTDLTIAEFTQKRNQLPRVITPRSHVLERWPECPL